MNKYKTVAKNWDEMLVILRESVRRAGGDDAELWDSVEANGGIIMNTANTFGGMNYFSYTRAVYTGAHDSFMSLNHATWQGAARAYLGWKVLGVYQ